MKNRFLILPVLLGLSASLLSSCASRQQPTPPAAAPVGATKGDGKTAQATDDLDSYQADTIPDPLEPVNRATFWANHQIYRYLLKPISKTYETIVPTPLRKGVSNVFDNVRFPVRFVNDTLQGKFQRAGQETGKFVVNSTIGVAGLIKVSDKFPALANVPPEDTGQTFGYWGIGPGFYFVIPLIGPSSARDAVGFAGDYALNPLTWIGIYYGYEAWTIPVGVTDTVGGLPVKLSAYDAATKDSLDRYLAARTAWVQYRAQAIAK